MHQLVLLAKSAVETFIKQGKTISSPPDLPREFFERKSGTFVTIEKGNSLRGCIGTYLPTRINIAEEIIHNAIAAATEDFRFSPISEEELSSLSYTVYILSYPEPVKDIRELDPEKFGIIVRTGALAFPNEENVVSNDVIPHKIGLLLPDLEGVDTTEQQVSIACMKGGIDPIKEKIVIYKFTVEKYI